MTKSKLQLAVDKDNTLGDYTDYLRQYTAAQKGIDPKELPDPTVEWLDKENMPYRDLYFLGDKDKAHLSADFLVDDGPHNIDAYQEAGRKTITFDQPYNTQCTGLRAKNWEEVVEIVKGYL